MPRGVPYDYLNLTDPNADVLAADASVRAHGVCEEGGHCFGAGILGGSSERCCTWRPSDTGVADK
jgi:hypothetical protein